MRILAFKVVQPLGEFFVTSMPAQQLTAAGRVRNRPRSSGAERSEDIQRVFSEKRIIEIADFSLDPQATFPTPIILAVDSGVIAESVLPSYEALANTTPSLICFEVPDQGQIGDVLDGQHRVLGLQRSGNDGEFDLPVVLMFDLSAEDKAFVFSIINSKQTPVSSSLIYDLFDLSNTRSPQKTCHYIAQALNSTVDSPFYQRLKMLGRREPHHDPTTKVMLSQGTFAARLQELISKDAATDARFAKDDVDLKEDGRCPLRKYFIAKDDASILKIVTNFFKVAAQTFHAEWADESGQFVIRKSVGYTALIIVLRHLVPLGMQEKNLSQSFFKTHFDAMPQRLTDTPLIAEHFPSSGAGAIKLAKTLLGHELNYAVTEGVKVEDVRLEG